jgi:thiosulfate reductase cytochrome b subunit
MTWFNSQHLQQAAEFANRQRNNPVSNYVWHFALSMIEAGKLLFLALGSVVHAIFPWVLNFKLLEWRVAALETLKNNFPNDPILKKINFNK